MLLLKIQRNLFHPKSFGTVEKRAAGLQITKGQAPVMFSGQTCLCSDQPVFGRLTVNCSCAQPQTPRLTPRNLRFFLCMANFQGGSSKLSNARRWERKYSETSIKRTPLGGFTLEENAPLYIMNQIRPVAKWNNSCTIELESFAASCGRHFLLYCEAMVF